MSTAFGWSSFVICKLLSKIILVIVCKELKSNMGFFGIDISDIILSTNVVDCLIINDLPCCGQNISILAKILLEVIF